MISGRSSGSGRYSFRESSDGSRSVMVAHMPEDFLEVRIIFKSHGEASTPIIKITDRDAILLWSSLKAVAEDLGWVDKTFSESLDEIKDKKK